MRDRDGLGRTASIAVLGLCVLTMGLGDDGKAKSRVIPAAEAHTHVGEVGTFAMTVRSSKDAAAHEEIYLDSEEDFHDEKNLALVISYDDLPAFRAAGIRAPAEYFLNKTIHVTGQVIHENDQTRIRVEDPKKIQLVEEVK